jgi:thiamine biosynthesis protein ThiI
MKLVSLISGGIDSPVATYLMLNKNVKIIAVHMDNRPFTDEKQVNKAIMIVNHLEKITARNIKMYIVPHGHNQLTFARECKRNLGCVLCRRMMYRISERIANTENAIALVTGESLGQVASQTLRNIRVESQSVKIPIVRPLIGFDKIEIEKLAKDIGTYEISTMPGLCCTIVPRKPVTRANLSKVLAEENKLDIKSLIEKSMKNARIK